MTMLARLLLVLTALAPICFVQAAVDVGRALSSSALDDRRAAFRLAMILAGIAVALTLTCALLLRGATRGRGASAPVPKTVKSPTPKEGEPLAFLVSYALPLVAAKEGGLPTLFALVAFGFVMAAAMWQLQVFHVNPLLAVFGYKFFAATDGDGGPVLVLARRSRLPSGELSVVRLSEYLWLAA